MPPAFGIVEGDTVFAGEGDLFAGLTKGAEVGAYDDLQILAPIEPGKVIAIGMNYLKHVKELDATREVPTEPVVFMKPQSAIVGPVRRSSSPTPRTTPTTKRNSSSSSASPPTASPRPKRWTTCLATPSATMSPTAYSRWAGIQWIRGKGYNTYLPLGPVIETELDPGNATVSPASMASSGRTTTPTA